MIGCKICGETTDLFDVIDLGKTCDLVSAYPRGLTGTPVYYRRCRDCGFIFTSHFDEYTDAEWKEVIYNAEYSVIDPDYALRRPARNARFVEILLGHRRHSIIGLDFGGGNGVTAEILRRRGWTFDSHDPFGKSEMRPSLLKRYNVATAFEVFEHVPDPIATFEYLLAKMTDDFPLVIIGTAVSDREVDEVRRLSWWYASPRNGHISLFSRRSLAALAGRFGMQCRSPSGGCHFLSRNCISNALVIRCWAAMIGARSRGTVVGAGFDPPHSRSHSFQIPIKHLCRSHHWVLSR
jgi:hypothetical protein